MKTLVLCKGDSPSKTLLQQNLKWADYFIAADGGANTARALGAPPDIVIGDMDSFEPKTGDSFEIIEDNCQETNDLEKALALAIKKGSSQVVVLGALGQRIDHTLKNLSVLKQFNAQFEKLVFRDNDGETKLISGPFSMKLDIGTTVSLFPLSGKVTGVSTEGLKYPLNNECLENGVRDGSSNKVISSPVTISFDEGDLILFVGSYEH